MAFNPDDLTVLAYADGFTLWHYVSDDSTSEVRRSAYFEEARDLFRNNDRIEVFADDGSFDTVITTVGRVRLREQ